MRMRWQLLVVAAWAMSCSAQDLRSRLEGLVYEVEDFTEPRSAWLQNKVTPDHWNLWTTEQDVCRKRSRCASLQSPRVMKDRATPEEGAPPLHTRITGIPNGLYHVYQSSPNRAIAISYDGKRWLKRERVEIDHGLVEITDGTFELWVDDRYAFRANLGPCYYDYIRFVPAKPPRFEHFTAFPLADGRVQLSWTTSERLPTGEVEFGPGEARNRKVVSPETSLRNHRVMVEGVEAGKEHTAQVRIGAGRTHYRSPVFRFQVVAPHPPRTTAETIPLTLAEPTERPRRAWPVMSGVPFARGKLARAADARLFDDRGRPVVADCFALSHWPDGSIRWLGVAALGDTGDAPRTLKLRTAPEWLTALPSPPRTLELRRTAEGYVVGTEPSPVVLSRRVANLELRPRLTLAEGELRARDADVVAVEHHSAVWARVRMEGDLVDADNRERFRWQMRWTIFAGSPLYGVRLTVINTDVSQPFATVIGLSARVARGDGLQVRFDDGGWLSPTSTRGARLLQIDDQRLRIDGAERQGRSAGLASWRDGKQEGCVFIRDFWQTWPRGFTADQQGLQVDLLPPLPEGLYREHKPEEVLKWSYWYDRGRYRFKRGMAFTTDLWLCSGSPPEPPQAFAAHCQSPLFLAATPQRYCASGAFGPVSPQREGEFAEYEAMVERGFQRLQKNRVGRREYGWMNFGDWHGERHDNWGNSEYDLQWCEALNFARSGDLRHLRWGEQMARHNTTIDTVHAPWSPAMPGLVYEHCVGHVGDFFTRDDPRVKEWAGIYGRGILRGAIDPGGHIFQPGNFLYARLLAEPEFAEIAERVVAQQATYHTASFRFGIERAAGWPLINAMAAYDETNNPFFLNAARLYLEKILELQDPDTGGWRMRQGPPECDHKQGHIGGKTFATGILLCGMVMYDRAEQRDDVRRSIIRACDWLMESAWDPVNKGFRYKTGCPKYLRARGLAPTSASLVSMGLCYASEITGDVKYREFALSWMGRMCQSTPTIGKSYAMMTRQAPFALHLLRRHGVARLPAGK